MHLISLDNGCVHASLCMCLRSECVHVYMLLTDYFWERSQISVSNVASEQLCEGDGNSLNELKSFAQGWLHR